MYPWISCTLDFGLQFSEKKCGLYMDVYGTKINLLTIIGLPVVTRSYLWLLVRELHLSALNNRYSKWN